MLDLNWNQIVDHLSHLGVAYLLALPVGWDREARSRGAGLRTFPLVAVAACGYALVGISVLESTEAESRVVEGLITGIGFIGGGAILKSRGNVRGTATAASIWITGLIGLAVAFRRYEVAIVMTLISFLTLRVVGAVKPEIDHEKDD